MVPAGDVQGHVTGASDMGSLDHGVTRTWPDLLGKLGDGQMGRHPLLCHMLDVQAVADLIWTDVVPEPTRRWVAADLGLDDQSARTWVGLLAGWHDLGKASPAFQLGTLHDDERRPSALRAQGLELVAPVTRARHEHVTALAIRDVLRGELGLPGSTAVDFAMLLGGHHGVFPAPHEIIQLGPGAIGGDPWSEARSELARAVQPDQGRAGSLVPPTGRTPRAIMVLAGLVCVADWIGSNTDHFPYFLGPGETADSIDPATYLEQARRNAGAALERLGWRAVPRPTGPVAFATWFRVEEPRPLQEQAERLGARLDGPGIVVIESPMGEGKTEAALHLADQWGGRVGARGAFIALPTQATSDQMYGRVAEALRRRYPDEAVLLQLLHGHAALSAEFETLRRSGDRLFSPSGVGTDGADIAPTVVAGTWFTARKRGLLAPYGVGTIDQVLLGALVTRHVFVRLFGLAGRVVILDEVHAYDTYMSTLLERLLEWLGALGSSVILLSATLPSERRARLLAAYGRGAGFVGREVPTTPYPRTSWITATSAEAEHVAASSASRRHVAIERVVPAAGGRLGDHALDQLVARLAAGGCAALVCNTVARAQDVFQRLRARLPGLASDGDPIVDLLHARFTYEERARREARALRRFGRGEAGRRPDRAILVATQIIEQSLDLDFDDLVTDFAPIDLLLQRSGRLHRHAANDPARPPALARPVLRVLCPPWSPDGEPDLDSGTRAVYDDHHVLLRTALALRDRVSIESPDDLADLVESVYAPADPPSTLTTSEAEAWRRTRLQAARDRDADEMEAKTRWLRSPADHGVSVSDLSRNAVDDDPGAGAFRALTRLDADGTLIVCLTAGPGGPCLDGAPLNLDVSPTPAVARRLLERSIRVGQRRLARSLVAVAVPTGWRRSALLRDARPLAFDADGRCVLAEGPDRPGFVLTLDPELGLCAEPNATGGGA